jgi:hypothetical protein
MYPLPHPLLPRIESSRNLIKCGHTDGLPCPTWHRTCQQRLIRSVIFSVGLRTNLWTSRNQAG